jgi:signal transduction histidine kinase
LRAPSTPWSRSCSWRASSSPWRTAHRSGAQGSIPVHVESDGIGRYPQEIESALYFCCLEALQNVAKYANATRVDVRLSENADELAFEVQDDGQGFDASSARRGSGLQGMADRLAAVGGTLDVRSAPGAGTTVTGNLPTTPT